MPDLLAHPEHEEQAVVGPGSKHEDDQQQLGDLRDLQTVRAELADQPRRDQQRETGRQQRDQRRQQRAEDHQQQQDDEDEREGLVLVGDVRRDRAGDVELETRRRVRGGDRVLQAVDQRLLTVDVGEVDPRAYEDLHGATVSRDGELAHGAHPRQRLDRRREMHQRGDIGSVERTAPGGGGDRHVARVVERAEDRRRERRRARARRRRRQKLTVVVVDLAAEARQRRRPDHRHDPQGENDPAEADHGPPEAAEEAVRQRHLGRLGTHRRFARTVSPMSHRSR